MIMGSQNLAELISIAEELLYVNPYFSEVRAQLHTLYSECGRQLFDQAVSENSTDKLQGAATYYQRACQLTDRRDNALGSDPRRVVEFLRLSQWFSAVGRMDESAQLIEKARLQVQMPQNGRLLDVVAELQAIVSSYPDGQDVRALMADIYIKIAEEVWGAEPSAYDYNSLGKPLEWFMKGFSLDPNSGRREMIEAHFRAATATLYRGDHAGAVAIVEEAVRRCRLNAESHRLGKTDIRLIQTRSGVLTNIGQLVGEIETFEKAKILGLGPNYRGVLLAPGAEVMNRAALDYVRPYVCVVTDRSLVNRVRHLEPALEYNTFWPTLNGKVTFHWPAMITVHREWERSGRGPVFTLRASQREQGWRNLEKLGMPRDAWFAILHVRDMSGGKEGVQVEATPTSNRDAKIESYLPAIQHIVDRGGWVVRMGDRSMPPLRTDTPHVIDYPHTDFKSDWMDIFLSAESRFLIGTASGLYLLPVNFGVPTIMTNISPLTSVPLSERDMFLPKLLRDAATKRILNFREMFAAPFGHGYNFSTFTHFGVEIINNTPEEIADGVSEMLGRLDGSFVLTPEDVELQVRFNSLAAEVVPGGLRSRIGINFLRRHRQLIA